MFKTLDGLISNPIFVDAEYPEILRRACISSPKKVSKRWKPSESFEATYRLYRRAECIRSLKDMWVYQEIYPESKHLNESG